MHCCPVCLSLGSLPLITVPRVPLIGCLFAESMPDALATEIGDLELVQCTECTHIYNRAFESERIRYVPGYENALGYSQRHNAQLTATVDHLICDHGLRHKYIAELGCGDANFLAQLCGRGSNIGIGYDPTQAYWSIRLGEGSVEVRSANFAPAKHDPVDFVCSQHVLEHLPELRQTLRYARSILKRKGCGYFEVPNGRTIFREGHIWDLTYEHLSYFTPQSLHRALSDAGFSVSKIESSFGDQYLYAEVLAEGAAAPPPTEEDLDFCQTFPGAFSSILSQWNDRISALTAEGRRIVLWGAGTKAVGFLNMLDIISDGGIKYVVDVNPRKSGRFVPRTAQKIVSPEHLRHYRPDVVIVMNAEYVQEIQTMLESMSVQCEVFVATGAPHRQAG
jgi:SAM-dependent methyltransferase